MARPKSTVSTTSAVDEEKITVEVEETTTNNTVEETETSVEKTVEVEKKTSKKQNPIGDEDDIKIFCPSLAGKKAIGKASEIIFDEKGFATVKGFEAKRLVTIPGFSIA